MIARKEIAQLPILPAKAKGRDEYIGRIRMHKDSLVMDVYDARRIMAPEDVEKEATPIFRWACDKKNYATYSFNKGEWTGRGINSSLFGMDYWWRDAKINLDAQSKQIADMFQEGDKEEWWYGGTIHNLCYLEDDIRQATRERREDRRRDRIEARQSARRPLPKDWERWLKNHVFREERYLFYDARNRKTGTCAYCETEVALDSTQRHGKAGKCPACGSRVRYQAMKKTPEICIEKQVIYLQKTDEGFLTRYLKVKKSSTKSGERYSSADVVLVTYNGKKSWCDYCLSPDRGREYWTDNRPSELSRWTTDGYLYTRNVRQALKETIFRYAPLAEWVKHERGPVPVGEFLSKFENSPFLEFFIKAGLYHLTADYIQRYEHWHGNTPQEILKINKQRIRRIIRMDGGVIALEWLQYEEEKGSRITDEDVAWLQDNHIHPNGCRNILDAIGSVARMVNYMKKQEIAYGQLTITWEDYLRMAAAEGMDTTDDIIRFPKNLKARHDDLVNRQNERKDAQRLKEKQETFARLDAQIAERLPEAARYYWENENYAIIPASRCEELMTEGRTLHHCVGKDEHYMEKMARGDSWILFLRKKESIETPYYTLEIRMSDDEILQWYSEFDRKPDKDEIQKVLKRFKQSLKKRKRVRVAAIA